MALHYGYSLDDYDDDEDYDIIGENTNTKQ